jgi:hypothetical protein
MSSAVAPLGILARDTFIVSVHTLVLGGALWAMLTLGLRWMVGL